MAKPLDIYARLSISIAGNPLNIRAADSLITIELPNLQAARALFKTGHSRHERRKFLGAVMAMLVQGDLQLEVRVSDWRVARLGVRSRPSLSSRLLGLSPLELRPMQMLRAITNRNK